MKYCKIILFILTEVYGTPTAAILRSMIDICCRETCGAMTKYDGRDDNKYNDINEDRNGNYNNAAGSESDDPIFDTITVFQSHGGGSGDNVKGDGAAAAGHYISTHWSIYLPYKNHSQDAPLTDV